jgi:hypothetical protein
MRSTPATAFRIGCLIVVLVVVGSLAFTIWQIRLPALRAKRVRETIHAGMLYEQVEELLVGRTFCFYQVQTSNGWESVPREDFVAALSEHIDPKPDNPRLHLTFMGLTPYRVSFSVMLDDTGKVVETTEPFGWD